MIYTFKNCTPVVDPSSYVHPQATIIGNVVIEGKVFIGAQAVLRGDIGSILVKEGANVQENCTIHMFPGKEVVLEENVHIGHGAVIHGANIGANSLIGMNSVIMDDVVVDKESIVGALSFVKSGTHVTRRSIYAGNPARRIKEVSDEMLDWKTRGTELYHGLAGDYLNGLKETEPLERPKNIQEKTHYDGYFPWRNNQP